MKTLLDLLKKHSFKRGSFTLVSGKTSDFYVDCKKTFLRQEAMFIVAARMHPFVDSFDSRAVAGEGLGGIPLASAVSLYANPKLLSLVLVRREAKDHPAVRTVIEVLDAELRNIRIGDQP